ncbi:hypothetical protein JVT61DRAFT_5147 [Boletus reticuloceps]|uniref:Uncharacterized protein n=1 Tax=Boletus reticuloceps TaxID=495285 RepID=A0A8I3AEU4_9AGAM|nr:hypothetical protein JVT61DRAFT_5147 [Boletus reticuloceps]
MGLMGPNANKLAAVSLQGITITLRDCPTGTGMLQGRKVQSEVTTSPQRKNVFSCLWNPESSQTETVNQGIYHFYHSLLN